MAYGIWEEYIPKVPLSPTPVYLDFTKYAYRISHNKGSSLNLHHVMGSSGGLIATVPADEYVQLYLGQKGADYSTYPLVQGENSLFIVGEMAFITVKIERILLVDLPAPWEKLIHLPQTDMNVYLDFTRYNYRAANNSTNAGIMYKNGVSVGSFTNKPTMLLESNGFTQGDNVLRSVNTGVRAVYIERQLLNNVDVKPWEPYHTLEIRTDAGFDSIYLDFDAYDYRVTPTHGTQNTYLSNLVLAAHVPPVINNFSTLHTWSYVVDPRALYINMGSPNVANSQLLKTGINYMARPSSEPTNLKYLFERREIGSPPDIKLNINGAIKEFDKGWVNINGELKEIDKMWTNINGVLREV